MKSTNELIKEKILKIRKLRDKIYEANLDDSSKGVMLISLQDMEKEYQNEYARNLQTKSFFEDIKVPNDYEKVEIPSDRDSYKYTKYYDYKLGIYEQDNLSLIKNAILKSETLSLELDEQTLLFQALKYYLKRFESLIHEVERNRDFVQNGFSTKNNK